MNQKYAYEHMIQYSSHTKKLYYKEIETITYYERSYNLPIAKILLMIDGVIKLTIVSESLLFH